MPIQQRHNISDGGESIKDALQPVRLTRDQIKQAISVMSRAFQDDPFLKHLAPDDINRARLTPEFVSIVVRYCHFYGEVWTTSSIGGVACWLTPKHYMPSLTGMLRTGALMLPFKFGKSGFQRFNDVITYTDTLHKQFAPTSHWYLWGLGVEPDLQGKGIGGVLMQPVVSRADAAGLPCYLETQNELNVAFYQKYGFDVVSDGYSPNGKLKVWVMVRQPISHSPN